MYRPPGFGNRTGGRFGGRGMGGKNAMTALVLMQLANQIARLPYKPPVTVLLIGAQVLLFLTTGAAPPVGQACFLPSKLLRYGLLSRRTLMRLFWSPLLHGSDMHLYYNMGSFLLKGLQLEQSHGSAEFAVMLVVLTLLTEVATFFSAVAADSFFGYSGWMDECAIGFSGVIFALKVILTFDSPGHSQVYGFQVPTRWVSWVELVVISMISPNVSFVGHLGGILGGLLFVALRKMGVVTAVRTALVNVFRDPGVGQRAPAAAFQPRRRGSDEGAGIGGMGGRALQTFWGSGTTGGGSAPQPAASGLRRRFGGGAGGSGASSGTASGSPVMSDAEIARQLQDEEDRLARGS